MAYKIIGCIAGLLTVARAGVIGPAAATVATLPPAATAIRAESYDPNPQYSFSYTVNDGLTGDNKAQQETRNGDVVQGSYSLIEPDGARRVVFYAADPINGFNAVVQRDPSITVNTVVAAAPVAAAIRPAVVGSPVLARPASVLTAAAPAAAAVHPQATILGAPLLRRQLLAGPTSVAATNGVTANTGLLDLGLGLGLRQGPLYSAQALLAGAYGTGGIVNVH